MIILSLIKTGAVVSVRLDTKDTMDPEDPVRVRKPSSVSLLSAYQNVPVSKSPLYLHQAGSRLGLRLRIIFTCSWPGTETR